MSRFFLLTGLIGLALFSLSTVAQDSLSIPPTLWPLKICAESNVVLLHNEEINMKSAFAISIALSLILSLVGFTQQDRIKIANSFGSLRGQG